MIELGGKTATGIRVPPEVVASLGSSKRSPVRVTINGYTYGSSAATMVGEFMLGVSAGSVRTRESLPAMRLMSKSNLMPSLAR